jgi:hypothetical protein
MKALTNPNVKVPEAASAPVAEKTEAPKALATAAPVSTTELTKELDTSKLSGPLFEHYDLAEEAIKVEKVKQQKFASALEEQRNQAETLRKQ